MPLDNIHLIGHSLGAHVAGFAGKEVEKQTGNKIGRITGLDPAGPYFEHPLKNPADRLSNNDAKLVDVIHTDGGFFGAINPMGTIDFYVNGGVRPQPGCTTITFVTPTSLESFVPVVFCSHIKSYLYFIESINSNNYQAIKCDSWKSYERGDCNMNENATFGANVESDKSGNYFIEIDH
ncbi:lipase member I [Agrilus planipennis]|uniref:Lipase member I n=1 Tax=Agrilus planipennis TaxID=224129 RepID=A0A1W4XVA5_AGRPL|nr:lipase member I [Agrilus planipennis]